MSEMIQACALMGFAALVGAHGADPRALLADVGISLDALENPDLPVPLDLLATLYHRAAQALDMADFGLRLSALQDSSIYGPLAGIALNSESVGDGLRGLSRYFSYHTPGTEIDTGPAADGRCIQVQYRLRLSDWVEPRQIIEQSYGMAAKLWRMIEPPGSEPIQILLRHQPAVDITVYETFYGCPTVFEQVVDAVWLPVSAMAARIDHADGRLREALQRHSPLSPGPWQASRNAHHPTVAFWWRKHRAHLRAAAHAQANPATPSRGAGNPFWRFAGCPA